MADKIEQLKIEKFKAFKHETVLNIEKRNLLVYGENGAGKSSLFDALKLVFFYQRIIEGHQEGATPEEQRERLASYLSNRYDHRNDLGFKIEVNGGDYLNFINSADYADYRVSMISNNDIQVGEFISYKELLEKVFIYGDVKDFMKTKCLWKPCLMK